MKPIHVFNVRPSVPEPLRSLPLIALNLRWAWDHDAIELFRRLDRDLWEATGHNPVLLLGSVDQALLDAAARDDSFLAHLERVSSELKSYLAGESTWYKQKYAADGPRVAYFSAEFGVTECLSIFAGGLGVLAGDHLKAGSDLGVPLTGVGLLYQQGYFRQYLNAAGWQQEAYEDNEFHTLPLERIKDVTVEVQLPGRTLVAQVWRAQVGRVNLYLMDTNIAQNQPQDRGVADQLYGGDLETRIQQEILLGIGGYRMLERLGVEATVFHMNEGHSAFLALERIRRLMESRGLSFAEARQMASAGLVFTTHTPVPAGHDYFPPAMMERYFGEYSRSLGLHWHEFMQLGRQDANNDSEAFCMTVLALRLAAFSNGVSKLHGEVSRRMWHNIWPGLPAEEIPIGHVTNGVHFRSWISAEMNQLYDRYLGPKWREVPADTALWKRVESIPAEELWRSHERRRERMVAFVRKQVRTQLVRRGAPQADIDASDEILNPDALTIGFGRRFAAYKRATLLLKDPERLSRILNNPDRPVQIVFAGKAHPRDNNGKELIRTIVALAQRPEFRRRVAFVENYDVATARYLVQGCDVWLNTPLRPLEASGTSGMKAQANGVLNVSTLDGWWDEAWKMSNQVDVPVGWAIGRGEIYTDPAYQDQVEAEALYDLLERHVVPAFYDRRADGLPRNWIARMKSSIATLCPQFNTHRQVKQYTEEYYLMAHSRYQHLRAEGCTNARELASWLTRVRQAWPHIRVEWVEDGVDEAALGTTMNVSACVNLAGLSAEDVRVELYLGRVTADDEITEVTALAMQPSDHMDGAGQIFTIATKPSSRSGLHGYTIRVLPYHSYLASSYVPGLITWADANVRVAPRAAMKQEAAYH